MIVPVLDVGELKRRADFVAIVSRYTRLHRAGQQYLGLCPFHSESTPSFYVEPERKIWKCFGCGLGGDVIDFVMVAEGCEFLPALRILFSWQRGVAGRSEPRSGERFAASEGGAAPSAREAGAKPSQSTRTDILARLDATERRNAGIARTNQSALDALATDCEPRSGEPLLVPNRISGHE